MEPGETQSSGSAADPGTVAMAQAMQHRLRNLCAGLGMVLDDVQGVVPGDERLARKIVLARDELAGARRLADRLGLAYGRLPEGQPGRLGVVVRDAERWFHDRYGESGPGLVVTATPDPCSHDSGGERALRNANWFELALREVLSNAAEASPQGAVELAWEREPGGLRGTVVNRVPESWAWTESEAVTFRARPGHDGLGLKVAQRCVLAMGGRFDLRRDGATVRAVLEVPDAS